MINDPLTHELKLIERRVDRGYALLATSWPEQLARVQCEVLDVASVSACVLGQGFCGFSAGLRTLWPTGSYLTQIKRGIAHGFNVNSFALPYSAQRATYFTALTAAWKKKLGCAEPADDAHE